MQIKAIKTKHLSIGDKLFDVLDQLPQIREESVIAITSKIISLCEGSIIAKDNVTKEELVRKECGQYLEGINKYGIILTIKNGILIPNAGIDESNGNGNYILWPKNPQRSANKIRQYLLKKFELKKLGVIITDSKTTPLRWGTTGISLAYSGFKPLNNYIGKKDLDGRKLTATKANVADGLAAAAVLAMGEGNERTPMALITDLPFVTFKKSYPSKKEIEGMTIDLGDDLYSGIIRPANWQKGG